MEKPRHRLGPAVVAIATAGCLWSAPAAAQPRLAASGVVSDTCIDAGQTSCSRGTVYVVNGTTLGIERSLTLWQGLPAATVGKLVVDRRGIYLYAAGSQSTAGTISGWIDVVDLRAMTKVASYAVSGSLLAGSPDGSRLYLRTSSSVLVIDGRTGAAVATIPAPDLVDLAASPAGDCLYIAQRLGPAGTSIGIVDATTYLLLDTIVLPSPTVLPARPDNYVGQLAVNDDGAHLYALTSSRVIDIDTASRTIAGAFTDFGGPTFLNRVVARGNRLFVSASGEMPGVGALEGVAALDASTRTFISLHPLSDPGLLEISSDGSRGWVQQFGGGSLGTFDTTTTAYVGSVLVPGGPRDFAAVPTDRVARVFVDYPAPGALARQPFTISGWAVDNTVAGPGPGVSTVHVWAFPASGGAPTFVGDDYGRWRPDVAAYLGPTFSNSGFSIPVRGLAPGAYRFVAYAFSLATGQFSVVTEVPVTIVRTAQLVVDTPSADARVSARFTIAGWAIDSAAPGGTGINAVHVWAYPVAGGAPVFAGAATIGDVRPDVGAYFGLQFERSGFHLEVSTLAPGAYTLVVYGRSLLTNTFGVEQLVRVIVNAPEPRMWVDTPGANAIVGTTFAVAGWAAEAYAPAGTGVDVVHVWATSASGAPTFLGAATYGGSRPDVAAWLGPQFDPSGFALTATLPPGAYTLSIYARSTTTGTFRQWQAVPVSVR